MPSPITDLHFAAGGCVAFACSYGGEVIRYVFKTGARRTLGRGCTAISAG